MQSRSTKSALFGGLLLVLACAVAGAAWWAANTGVRATDDAYVDTDVVAVAAEAAGRVTQVSVRDNQKIERGAALLQIDPQDLQLNLDQATAGKAAADADQKSASAAPTARKRSAKAAVDAAQARLDQAKLKLDRAELRAPIAGYVTRRTVSEGSYVRPGEPVLALVSPKVWVTANLKETQLAGVEPGATADIRIDAYPRLRLKGHVESLQHGAGQAFSLLPPDNASGNFVKVVQRVPVKLAIDGDPAVALGPGLSAHVRIHAR